MTRTPLLIGIGALLVLIAGSAWLLSARTAVAPSPVAPEPLLVKPDTATLKETLVKPVNKTPPYAFPIAPGDTIVSWNYDGYLKDNGPREATALQEIENLKSQIGTENDYSTYIALAQEYDHLGDGKSAYLYLSRAIALDKNRTTGVGWHNMGILMEKLGAYASARVAHEEAVKIQPGISAFQMSRVELMVYHFPKDTAGVEKAFADAEAVFGANDPTLIDLRARWQTFL